MIYQVVQLFKLINSCFHILLTSGDNNGLCKLRFYYHLFGLGIGTLRVLAADRYSQRTLWTKSYSQLNDWGRAEVPLFNMSSSFYVSSYTSIYWEFLYRN